MYEEKDLGHSKRVFNLFRRGQVWTLSLSRVTGFLRERGLTVGRWSAECPGLGWEAHSYRDSAREGAASAVSWRGSCEGWVIHRERTPIPTTPVLRSSYSCALGPSWRHSIAFPGPQVNVLALSICTREAYQSMKERNVDDGHIININR